MKGSRVVQNVFTEVQQKREYIMRNLSSEISPSFRVSIGFQNESLEVVELSKENFTAGEVPSKNFSIGRSFTVKKGNLEFIYITKTGGTTIEAWAASKILVLHQKLNVSYLT